jgi:hypothetical protein
MFGESYSIPKPPKKNRENVFEIFTNATETQKVRWTNLENDVEYAFEVISPLKASINLFKKTKYMVFITICRKTTDKPIINEGDTVILELPIKTFEHAMWLIPATLKANLNPKVLGNDNMYFKFKKNRRQDMFISIVERRKITPEQETIARDFYD